MKTMTCRELGGACDVEFHAETFDEMAKLSQQHGQKMFEQGDGAHLAAMQAMRNRMESTDKMHEWMEARRAEFEAKPDD